MEKNYYRGNQKQKNGILAYTLAFLMAAAMLIPACRKNNPKPKDVESSSAGTMTTGGVDPATVTTSSTSGSTTNASTTSGSTTSSTAGTSSGSTGQ